MTVSYYEWARARQREPWADDEVVARLRTQMTSAWRSVVRRPTRWSVDWRMAAQAVAIEPLAEASELRAVYP